MAGGTFGVRSSANKLISGSNRCCRSPTRRCSSTPADGADFDLRVFTSVVYQSDRFDVGLELALSVEPTGGRARADAAVDGSADRRVQPVQLERACSASTSGSGCAAASTTLFDEDPPLTGANPYHLTQPTNGTGNTDRGSYDVLGRRYYVGVALEF